jgi:hypothetical protein
MREHRLQRTLLSSVKLAITSLWRRRHYAVTSGERTAKAKLEPISKILADAGREHMSPVD